MVTGAVHVIAKGFGKVCEALVISILHSRMNMTLRHLNHNRWLYVMFVVTHCNCIKRTRSFAQLVPQHVGCSTTAKSQVKFLGS